MLSRLRRALVGLAVIGASTTFVSVSVSTAAESDGTVDSAFGNGGVAEISGNFRNTLALSDGAIVAFASIDTDSDFAPDKVEIKRFTSAGVLDTGFANAGTYTIQPAGHTYIQYSYSFAGDNGGFYVVYTSNDPNFLGNDAGKILEISAQGTIIGAEARIPAPAGAQAVGAQWIDASSGNIYTLQRGNVTAIVKQASNLVPDTSFGDGGTAYRSWASGGPCGSFWRMGSAEQVGLWVDPTETFALVAGFVDGPNNYNVLGFAKLTLSNGVCDTSFGADYKDSNGVRATDGTLDGYFEFDLLASAPDTIKSSMQFQSDGSLVVGITNASNSLKIARVTSAGALDTNFNTTGVSGELWSEFDASWISPSVYVLSDGKVRVVGKPASGTGLAKIVGLTAAGLSDLGFGTGGAATSPSCTGVNYQNSQRMPDGSIIVNSTMSSGNPIVYTTYLVKLGNGASSHCGPATISYSTVMGTVGTPIASATPTAVGFTSSPTYTISPNLPGGLSLASNGVISGTPTAAGNTTHTVTATNGSQTATASVTVNISNGAQNPNNPNNPQPQQCTTGAYTLTGSSPVLDTSWGTSGFVSVTTANSFFYSRGFIPTPDGTDPHYLLLSTTTGQNGSALAVSKVDAAGAAVSGFGTNGMLTISANVNLDFAGFGVDAAGKIYVLTRDYMSATYSVVGLTSTGLLDTSFGTNGLLAITLPQGESPYGWNPVIGGAAGEFFVITFAPGQQSTTYRIHKFDSSGLVNGFGTAGVLDVTSVGGRSMLVLQDGSLLVGGSAQGQLTLSKYSSAGVLDTTWATNGVSTFGNPSTSESISDLDISGQSVIITYRSNVFVQNGPPQVKNGVAKVGLDGVVDTTFGDAGGVLAPQRTGATFAAEGHVLSDGSIVVALFSDTGFQDQTLGMIRFSATGDLDTAFASDDAKITHGTCGVDYVGIVDLGNGALLIAGSKSVGMNAPTESALAKLTVSAVVPGINGGGFTGSGSSPSPSPNNNVFVPVTPPTTPDDDGDDEEEPRVPGRPNLVNDDNRPGLVRPPGQPGLVVDGETQEVVTTRVETPGANVQPNRRTPAQIQQIREAANSLVQNFQQQLPAGTQVPFEVVNTPTGAVIRNLVFDASGNPVDVPAEDVVLMEAQEMVLLVGANQANVTPDGRFQVPVGSSFGLAGSGFGEEEDGEFVVMSTPTLVAEFATAEDGTFEKSAALPASIGVGDHTLVVATGSTYAVLGIQVVPTTLPVTGGDSNQVVVFALFTMVFGALLVRSRRTLLV
jgi:uncharacterized delta-60 repeat protein